MGEISGPLGIWRWPVLNAIVDMVNSSGDKGNTVEVTEVIRDENGRIQSIETIRK